ncbi:MAG: TonB-dependent receptor [Ginsengibacter sp.]
MLKFIPLLFAFLLGTLVSESQTITGSLIDSGDRTPVANATVRLLNPDSTSTPNETVSNAKGVFIFRNVRSGNYIVEVTSIGFSNYHRNFSVTGENVNLGNLGISKIARTLETVVIDGTPPPVRQRNDTLEYSASQYKLNTDATSEDLIKKMPGVTVDRSGTVTAQGENVRKVTVDGRDFFGDDAIATLRNLPAEVIDKIQVFDRLSDQAQLTGFDDGNTTKSINIVTKADMRSGNFGRIYAGYGTDDKYSAGGNVSFFNNARRISLLGLTNNVNQQNFASQDLLGATSSGNRGGGGMRGGGGGRGGGGRGGGENFSVGQQSGTAKTNAFGINYSDEWGKKMEVSGSYFFNNSNTSNNQTINRQNFLKNNETQFYDEISFSNNKNFNNRVNFRLNYKIDSSNSILFTSALSFQNNRAGNFVSGLITGEDGNKISSTINELNRNSSGYNLNNNLLYRHAFTKRGRSISVGFNTSLSRNNGENFVNAENDYYKSVIFSDTTNQYSDQKSNTNRYSVNLVYTEPFGKKGQLQLNYNPAVQKSNADQLTFNFSNADSKYNKQDTSLSNLFDNTYNTHNSGLTYRYGDRDNMISAGISYQYSELNSDQVYPLTRQINTRYNNVLANAFGRLKLSSKSNMRIIYRTSVSAPSVNQLQNVINTSNQLFYSTGNPSLNQQYTSNYITRYTYTNSVKGQSLFANLFISTINDYVSNATFNATQDSALSSTVTLYKGSQLSKPVNLDGYFSARSFFTFGLPVKFIKSNLNFNAGISYAKLPGLLNNVENISNSYNYNLGAVLASNINEYVDFTLSYSANINDVKNSIRPSLNNNYFTQSAGFTTNFLTKKGSFFQNDISNQSYKGLTDGFNQSYWLWNMAVGQKFLKDQKGELKLSVFDLLKQNKSITRDVTESYVQDIKNQVLQQYFMLTFTYKLKTFGKGKAPNNREGNRMFMSSSNEG